MLKRYAASIGTAAALLAGISLLSISGAGQATNGGEKKSNYATPKTPWGDPDLQGIYTSNDNVGVPIERPEKFGTRIYLNDEEFKERDERAKKAAADNKEDRRELKPGDTGDGPEHWYERGKTSRRSSLVIDPPDGKIPVTPAMKKRAEDWEKQRFGDDVTSWRDFDLWDRCITKGLPTVMVPLGYNNSYQIFQSPGVVAIFYEVIHDWRIIPLDGKPHIDQSVRQWWGDSRGHWEGDTLVVDVTNFRPDTLGNQQPIGEYRGGGTKQHLVERFTRTSPDEIDYQVTIDDPDVASRPFTLDIPIARDDNYQAYEYACHEGNYSMVNMLEGLAAKQKKAGKPVPRSTGVRPAGESQTSSR
jgi:hypothetical protein